MTFKKAAFSDAKSVPTTIIMYASEILFYSDLYTDLYFPGRPYLCYPVSLVKSQQPIKKLKFIFYSGY